jgi:hypothetical protein
MTIMVCSSQWLEAANSRNQRAKVAAAIDVEKELGPVDNRQLFLLTHPQTLTTFLLTYAVIPTIRSYHQTSNNHLIPLRYYVRSSRSYKPVCLL